MNTNILSEDAFHQALFEAMNLVTYLNGRDVCAYVVGGAVRHLQVGGGTGDVDIAILTTVGEFEDLLTKVPERFSLQHDRCYMDNDGFLADWRCGDVNIIAYDESKYHTIDQLVGRFDININQSYLNPLEPMKSAIVNKHFDGVNVNLNPLRMHEFGRDRMVDRVERFKNRLPNLNWDAVDALRKECELFGVYYGD